MSNKEIERKFLVCRDGWPKDDGVDIDQGYLYSSEVSTVRIRLADDVGWLTIKGKSSGHARDEFEYEIPRDDALALLALCGDKRVRKRRYRVAHGEHTWEVDVFEGRNAGLLMAEIEAESEAALSQAVANRPAWVAREVSHDPRFFNSALAQRPYSTWSTEERQALEG